MVRDSLLLLLDHRLPGQLWRDASSLAEALRILHNTPDIHLVLLDLTEATVKTHLQAIYRKLSVESRTQALAAIARRGLPL